MSKAFSASTEIIIWFYVITHTDHTTHTHTYTTQSHSKYHTFIQITPHTHTPHIHTHKHTHLLTGDKLETFKLGKKYIKMVVPFVQITWLTRKFFIKTGIFPQREVAEVILTGGILLSDDKDVISSEELVVVMHTCACL